MFSIYSGTNNQTGQDCPINQHTPGKWRRPKKSTRCHPRRYSDDGSGSGSDQEDSDSSTNQHLSGNAKKIRYHLETILSSRALKFRNLMSKLLIAIDVNYWYELSNKFISRQHEDALPPFFKKKMINLISKIQKNLCNFGIVADEFMINSMIRVEVLCCLLYFTMLNTDFLNTLHDTEKICFDHLEWFLNGVFDKSEDCLAFCASFQNDQPQIPSMLMCDMAYAWYYKRAQDNYLYDEFYI
jgi:hypothetical protein